MDQCTLGLVACVYRARSSSCTAGLACTMGGWNPQLDELLAEDEQGRPLTQVGLVLVHDALTCLVNLSVADMPCMRAGSA